MRFDEGADGDAVVVVAFVGRPGGGCETLAHDGLAFDVEFIFEHVPATAAAVYLEVGEAFAGDHFVVGFGAEGIGVDLVGELLRHVAVACAGNRAVDEVVVGDRDVDRRGEFGALEVGAFKALFELALRGAAVAGDEVSVVAFLGESFGKHPHGHAVTAYGFAAAVVALKDGFAFAVGIAPVAAFFVSIVAFLADIEETVPAGAGSAFLFTVDEGAVIAGFDVADLRASGRAVAVEVFAQVAFLVADKERVIVDFAVPAIDGFAFAAGGKAAVAGFDLAGAGTAVAADRRGAFLDDVVVAGFTMLNDAVAAIPDCAGLAGFRAGKAGFQTAASRAAVAVGCVSVVALLAVGHDAVPACRGDAPLTGDGAGIPRVDGPLGASVAVGSVSVIAFLVSRRNDAVAVQFRNQGAFTDFTANLIGTRGGAVTAHIPGFGAAVETPVPVHKVSVVTRLAIVVHAISACHSETCAGDRVALPSGFDGLAVGRTSIAVDAGAFAVVAGLLGIADAVPAIRGQLAVWHTPAVAAVPADGQAGLVRHAKVALFAKRCLDRAVPAILRERAIPCTRGLTAFIVIAVVRVTARNVAFLPEFRRDDSIPAAQNDTVREPIFMDARPARLDLAGFGTSVAAKGAALFDSTVVALLVVRHHAVAAYRMAVRVTRISGFYPACLVAPVARLDIPVVTFLIAFDDAVATDGFHRLRIARAPVRRTRPARLDRTCGRTSVVRCLVSVVAILTVFENPVAADRDHGFRIA